MVKKYIMRDFNPALVYFRYDGHDLFQLVVRNYSHRIPLSYVERRRYSLQIINSTYIYVQMLGHGIFSRSGISALAPSKKAPLPLGLCIDIYCRQSLHCNRTRNKSVISLACSCVAFGAASSFWFPRRGENAYSGGLPVNG